MPVVFVLDGAGGARSPLIDQLADECYHALPLRGAGDLVETLRCMRPAALVIDATRGGPTPSDVVRAIEQVREQPSYEHLPVIAIGGNAHARDRLRTLFEGDDASQIFSPSKVGMETAVKFLRDAVGQKPLSHG